VAGGNRLQRGKSRIAAGMARSGDDVPAASGVLTGQLESDAAVGTGDENCRRSGARRQP